MPKLSWQSIHGGLQSEANTTKCSGDMNYDFNMYPFDVEISISSTKVKSNYENNKKMMQSLLPCIVNYVDWLVLQVGPKNNISLN